MPSQTIVIYIHKSLIYVLIFLLLSSQLQIYMRQTGGHVSIYSNRISKLGNFLGLDRMELPTSGYRTKIERWRLSVFRNHELPKQPVIKTIVDDNLICTMHMLSHGIVAPSVDLSWIRWFIGQVVVVVAALELYIHDLHVFIATKTPACTLAQMNNSTPQPSDSQSNT